VLQVVELRYRAGTASPTEVAAQAAALDAVNLQLVELEQAEVQSRAALALLLGRAPEAFDVTAKSLEGLHEPVVSPGLPSALLTRRPDLVQAESQLRAANASVAAARAALLPSLSLTASGGVQNPALPATVTTIAGTGPSFALSANLIQPIFDHGRLRAQRDEALARERELLAGYQGAILAALVDVEAALSALEHLERARPAQEDNVLQSERSLAGARLRYERGAGEILPLLDAQRTLYAARDQYAQYRLARLRARVALCKALGGGWQADAI
jgi:NodT family efflux transporter outer membrane factor (OMF) lipoprotein